MAYPQVTSKVHHNEINPANVTSSIQTPVYGGEIPSETEHGGVGGPTGSHCTCVVVVCRASEASIRRCCRATPVHGPLSPARPHVQSAILPYLHISLYLCGTWIFNSWVECWRCCHRWVHGGFASPLMLLY